MKSPTAALLGLAALALTAMPPQVGATTISFQEGVSPSAGYTADSTYIRDGTSYVNSAQDDDPQFENIVGYAGGEMRPMFAFDLTEIETTAAGNPFTIDSVQLVLTSRGANLGETALQLDLHEYGFSFVEANATWNNPDGVAGGDTTAGGTLGTVLQSLSIDKPVDVVKNDTLTFADSAAFRTAVGTALDGDNTLRLLLKGDVTSGASRFIRVYDEVFATTGARPELVVDFTVIPEPTSLALLGLGGLLLTRRRR